MDSQELTHPYLLHPRTGEPLRAIATHPKTGHPVWPIMGGDGSEGDANDGGAGDDGSADTATGDADKGETEADKGDETDPRVQRANREAASYRTRARAAEQAAQDADAKHQQLLDNMAKALGLKSDDDPAEQVTNLTGTVETLTNENAAMAASLLVHNLCSDPSQGLNANPAALLDSRSFADTLKGLDPKGENYTADVAKAIKDAVTKNAAFKAGQGSSRGGSELNGDQRETTNKQRPAGGLAGAISAAYGS